jgi:hypothetical protein
MTVMPKGFASMREATLLPYNSYMDHYGVDRSALSIATLEDDSQDKIYWMSRTPEERLEHMEMLRRINHGNAATARLQRILEIVERKQS